MLLHHASSGLRLEQLLSLRAQRELWSALVRLAGARDAHALSLAARRLAQRFLLLAELRAPHDADLVSCSLARAVVRATTVLAVGDADSERRELEQEDGDNEDDASLAAVQRDAAFRDAMKQLVVAQLAVPALEQLAPLTRENEGHKSSSAREGGGGSGGDAMQQQKVLLRFTRRPQQPADKERQQVSARDILALSEDSRRTQQDPDDELVRRSKRARVAEQGELARLHQDGSSNDRVLPPPAPKLAPEVRWFYGRLACYSFPLTLGSQVEEKASKLGKQLSSAETQASSRALLDEAAKGSVQLIQETINATSVTQAETETLLRRLCELLQLATCSDEALFQITRCVPQCGAWLLAVCSPILL